MAYQRKIPEVSGTFALREFKGRWGAYWFPAGTPTPSDIEPFRLWDSQCIKKHLEDNFSRAEMLNKAGELGVTIPSSSASKPSKSSVAHAMSVFLSKPLSTDFMTCKSPLVDMSGDTCDDTLRYIESELAEYDKHRTKAEAKQEDRMALKVANMLKADTSKKGRALMKKILTLTPAEIVQLKQICKDDGSFPDLPDADATSLSSENEDNRNIRYIRVVASNIPHVSPSTVVIDCKSDETVYESKCRLFADMFADIFNGKDVDALAVSLSFVPLGSSDGIEIDNHATWGGIDTDGDGVVEVMVAVLQNEFRGQFLAGSTCVQLVETGYLRDELSLNEKKENAKTLTIKVPTEKGNVRLYYYYTPKDTFYEVYECINNIVGPFGKEFKLKWDSSASILEEWEPIDATLRETPSCTMVVALRGGGKRAKSKADDADIIPITLKQLLNDNIVRLKSLTGGGEAIQTALDEVEKIVKSVADNPTTPVSSMFDVIPASKKATILSSTIESSTRADERAEFIAEQALSEMMERLDEQERMTALAKKTLCLAVRYAIHSEFQDAKGGIGWQQMMKVLADKMAEPVSETGSNRCITM